MTEERAVRLGAACVFAAFVVVGVAVAGAGAASASAGLGALAVGLVLSVRAWPDRVVAAGLLLAALGVHLVCSGDPANLGWFAVCALAGWAGTAVRPALSVPVGAVLAGSFVWQWLAVSTQAGWGAWVAGTLLSLVACLAARRQRQLLDQLHAAQAGLADAARDHERARIARELHDVIGHALTVSLLHVTSARLALADGPAEEAAASLAEAERLSRESLAEVRAVVGLMQGAAGTATTALPGADSWDELVATFRRAGAEIGWSVDGDPAGLTAAAGLTVHRVLQEALTNAVRHAPGTPVTAGVRVGRSAVELCVVNPVPVRVPTVPGPDGSGLSGMRARVDALGGRLVAGPDGDRWRVEAVLPR